MPKELASGALRPYKAVLVAQVEDSTLVVARKILGELREVLDVKGRGSRLAKAEGVDTADDTEAAFVHYQDKRQVSWAKTPIIDIINHLAVVVVHGEWVAIACTEGSRRDAVQKALRRGKLGPMRPVRPGRLKLAFIKGRTRTLWLKGTHRRTSYKADTKVLGGTDLVPALDPLGDQTFRYTAARCEPSNEDIGEIMGLAVDQSRVWIGPSTDWHDFLGSIVAMLEQLGASSESDEEPLPVVAAAKADLAGIDGAYDIAVTPPELLMVGPVLDTAQAALLEEMERLAFGTHFEVTGATGAVFEAVVLRGNIKLGDLKLELREDHGEVETVVDAATPAPGHESAFAEILGQIREHDALTVYFDSGHTIQDRQAYAVRHRDVPFDGWAWVPFGSDWNIDREKPTGGVPAVGTDTSLFDWVLAEWPSGAALAGDRGWLACDDRPGETADFLHLDESGNSPLLTLIHAKGANSTGPNRGISVVAYETVCGQAIKNLRHLDATLASGTLVSGTVSAALNLSVWENGVQRSRADFINQLDALGANVRRRIVIVQPHVRRSLVEEVRAAREAHAEWPRLRQLDTLLLGVAGTAQSASAELLVVGSDE